MTPDNTPEKGASPDMSPVFQRIFEAQEALFGHDRTQRVILNDPELRSEARRLMDEGYTWADVRLHFIQIPEVGARFRHERVRDRELLAIQYETELEAVGLGMHPALGHGLRITDAQTFLGALHRSSAPADTVEANAFRTGLASIIEGFTTIAGRAELLRNFDRLAEITGEPYPHWFAGDARTYDEAKNETETDGTDAVVVGDMGALAPSIVAELERLGLQGSQLADIRLFCTAAREGLGVYWAALSTLVVLDKGGLQPYLYEDDERWEWEDVFGVLEQLRAAAPPGSAFVRAIRERIARNIQADREHAIATNPEHIDTLATVLSTTNAILREPLTAGMPALEMHIRAVIDAIHEASVTAGSSHDHLRAAVQRLQAALEGSTSPHTTALFEQLREAETSALLFQGRAALTRAQCLLYLGYSGLE